ncbi:MAG: hypothetical protein QOG73_759, partial [Acetobacteraceae bacterium]|nr:hypothetical protein [Acetobacteraceae bacterium]
VAPGGGFFASSAWEVSGTVLRRPRSGHRDRVFMIAGIGALDRIGRSRSPVCSRSNILRRVTG